MSVRNTLGSMSLGSLLVLVLVHPGSAVAADSENERRVPIPSLGEQLMKQWTPEGVTSAPVVTSGPSDDTVSRMSLRDAVATALERNPGIAVRRLGPTYARAGISRAYGIFDPEFTLFGRTERSATPTGSSLAGASIIRERVNRFGGSVQKLLRTGARLTVAYDSEELDVNSEFVGLRPQYKPELRFSLSQPLLRNFGLGLSLLLVRSAESQAGAADGRYRAEVASLIRDVVTSYWSVVSARESSKAEEDGLRLARSLQTESEARVKAGVLPPVAVQEAEAEAARREERVLVAQNVAEIALEKLRLLLQYNPEGSFLPRRIDPIDSPEVRPIEFDDAELLRSALERRPELEQARHDIEAQKIRVRLFRNNLLPSVDLDATYALSGLSGRGVPQRDFATGEERTTEFTGDYGEALDRLSSDRFNRYGAGLTVKVPIGNTTAEADYVQGQIDLRRAELGYRQLLADIALEVRRAASTIETDSKRITVTRLARELAQVNLDQQKKRHDVGLATTKDLLDFQEKLTAARAAEIRALVDYNVSIATLRQAEGTLLESFSVVIEELPVSGSTVWSVF